MRKRKKIVSIFVKITTLHIQNYGSYSDFYWRTFTEAVIRDTKTFLFKEGLVVVDNYGPAGRIDGPGEDAERKKGGNVCIRVARENVNGNAIRRR